MNPTGAKRLNLYEKLLKIADIAGVLRKNKQGFNYKYTTEDEIQAKITAGMQKYNVLLLPSLIPGTLEVSPIHYEKLKPKAQTVTPENLIPVNEVIVKAEVKYTWIDTENPEDKIDTYWAYIGQMEDASQAFGAGATYGNRYYLLKALQLATTESDPDEYRSKQQAAENYETEKAKAELKTMVDKVKSAGSLLIGKGVSKDMIVNAVSKYNDGNGNPSSIQSIEVCASILAEFESLMATIKKGE